ncbi:hypothetical protein KIW84_070157 [Lathyrus oleraceus]|uniref:DUF7745 domain-containing protein n=1 Tax=Pisum sativum TaxID=3888 RepID=A0A9D4VGR0_PEA|nr:hypothetical protein KIW84_070157 [Pisum sativum]
MDGPPDAKDLQPFVLSNIQASNPDVRAVRKAWLKVVRMGKEFGKRNILAKEPYTQWVKERVEEIQLPYILKAPALPKTPEPEPILLEDMEKLVTKVKELEVENADLRIQMNRVILENQNLKEERKGKAQELEDSNKRARLLEDQKDDLDHILLGSTSVIRTRKEELKKAEYRICELGRLLDKSLMDKKEIKLDFEAQIRDLREALKKCEEKLSREILQKEEAERNCHHLRYQLEEATRRFAVLESQEDFATLVTSAEIQPGMTYVLQVSTTDEVNTTNFSIKTDNATTRHNVDNHENWKRVLETALPITNLFSAKDWYNSMKTVEAIKDANKRGALHFAAFEGQTEICKYLLEDLKLEIDSRDDDGETALIHAARQGHITTLPAIFSSP